MRTSVKPVKSLVFNFKFGCFAAEQVVHSLHACSHLDLALFAKVSAWKHFFPQIDM
jgi:hypothetical protein